MNSLNNYDFIYLITNIFNTYTIFEFMKIFFDREEGNKRVEFISYAAYFMVISFTYLVLDIPIITFACNLSMFFVLTFNYKALVKNRLLSAVFIYAILMSIESIVVILSGYFQLSLFDAETNYSSISGIIIIRIVSYVIMLIMKNYKNIKKGIPIANSYWLAVFFIPLGTLYISLVIFQSENLTENQIIVSIGSLLMINIFAFYLYDILNKIFEDKMEKILLKQQNTYYSQQFRIMDSSYKNIKSVRHDIKNHLLVLEAYIKKDKKEAALNYIHEVIHTSYGEKEFADSGNVDIDSILNYKIQEAVNRGIAVNLELKIPSDINIRPFDITIIFANLLDNAIEATLKLKNNKKINICITYRINTLLIHMDNTFNGDITYEGDTIITSHKDQENHGIGLNNIKKVLKKYNGTMKIQHTDRKFYADILMYIP